jgi:hypothetical protein
MSAIPDPEHNAKMLALIKARELALSRSWIEDHPFALPANFERIRHDQRIIDSIIRLNHRHFWKPETHYSVFERCCRQAWACRTIHDSIG